MSLVTFQSVNDSICKEQYLIMQLRSEWFLSSLENTDGLNPSMILYVIGKMNSAIEK